MKRAKKAAAAPAAPVNISASEAVRRAKKDLSIPKGRAVSLPDESNANAFHARVRIASIADLQRLSFVPAGLKEDKLLAAIRRDDDTALEAAQRAPTHATAGCDCAGGDKHAAAPMHPVAALRSNYLKVRRRFNPELSRLLSEIHQREVAWDSPMATHIYRWVDKLRVAKVFDIGTLSIRDIVVGNNATLALNNSTQLLWANDIRIHVGGKIKTTGSYLKIQCSSIQGNLA